ALAILLLAACGDNTAPPPRAVATHSSSIALSADRLFVVNADSDSVSLLDPATSSLVAEVSLGTPAVDPSGAYTPSVMPRALAVTPDGATVYVTGQRAGALFAIDVAT